MTIYIRDQKNNTLADIEFYIKEDYIELSSSINIINYSYLLKNYILSFSITDYEKLIIDFDNISELRGWLWENYFMGRRNTKEEYIECEKALMKILEDITKTHNLVIVTD